MRPGAVVGIKCFVNLIRRDDCRQRTVSGGQAFGKQHEIRLDSGMVAGEELSGPAETGHDFVRDQVRPVRIRPFAQAAQEVRAVDQHSRRTLKHRLKYNRRDPVRMFFELRLDLFPLIFGHVLPFRAILRR